MKEKSKNLQQSYEIFIKSSGSHVATPVKKEEKLTFLPAFYRPVPPQLTSKEAVTFLDESVQKEPQFKDYLYKSTVQASLTSIAVATTLFPFEWLRTSKQLKIGFMGWKSVANNYGNAVKGSFIKNGVMSQKETVHTEVELVVNKETEHTASDEMATGLTNITKAALAVTAVTSVVMAIPDTLATQVFANKRIFSAMGMVPAFKNAKEFLSFSTLGLGARYTRNLFNAFCCIASMTLFSEQLNSFLPIEQYKFLNPLTSILSSSFLAATFSNALDMVYVQQIKAAAEYTKENNIAKKFKSPSAFAVAKNIYATHGLKGFTPGMFLSIVCTAIAYATIAGVDTYVNEYLFALSEKQREQKLKQNNQLFSPASASENLSIADKAEKKEYKN